MPRKRSKAKRVGKPKPNLRVWEDRDRLELLAYLNWCVQCDVNFNTTVVGHLKKTTGKDFLDRQIRDKLRREWENFGICDKFEDLYSQGTTALNQENNEDEMQVIQEMLVRLGSPLGARYRLRSASSVHNSRSRTLSTALSTSTRVTPASQLARVRGSSRPHSGLENTWQRTDTEALRQSAHSGIRSDESGDELAREYPTEVVKGEEYSELSSVPCTDDSDLELITLASPTKSSESELRSGEEGQALGETTNTRVTETEFLKQSASVFTLRNRLSEMQRELDEMHESSQAARGNRFDLWQQISHLRGQLEAKDRLWQDTVAFETQSLAFSKTPIKRDYDLLYHKINETCSFICDMSLTEALPEQDGEFHPSAETWALKAANCKLDRLVSHSQAEAIPKEKLFASLVAAGIFELVFEPVVPDILALESPLLHQYRRHILTKDGQQALHRLDFVALKSLTLEKHFTTEVIPEKARSLAEFMVRILCFFLPKENQDINHRPLHYHQEILAAECLEKVISQALLLKVQLALSMKRLGFRFFKPGEPFDATCMQSDSSRSAGFVEDPDGPQDSVKLCLLPALYVLPAGVDDQEHEDSVMHFSANYNKYLTEVGVEDAGSLFLVVKSSVMV
ncbi:hypothetical protein FZEAL_6134 [Fusarium zealandicum]|uniref:Uncharacterized protein n=1 Tax=Fusarium zealandicum TaxID=1053134 RepID=A0A8H4XJW6_9HYPO|nr:hypothetical protein FZEAL_6134 [Fusarium zealandicum]